MTSLKNQQLSLKPQDLVVILKLILAPDREFTYATVAKALFMSASEVHASMARARRSQLIGPDQDGTPSIARSAVSEFILHGARYAFPPCTGPLVRGIPTAHASPALRDLLVQSDEPPPVWPYARGTTRGIALYPLYPTVPRAAESDPALYNGLALFDALRLGRTRERDLAATALGRLLI